MSKVNQIQNKLRELDGGAFQKLADAFLRAKGYEQINAFGSLIGGDKVRKGTPDTFMPLRNGKFVFAEHTTQKTSLLEKFQSDIKKCLDEKKTGLAVNKIQEIVLCHTSMLNVAEESQLIDLCQQNGVDLSIFGISPISFDLYQKYPGLARDFLGIEVDTGQVVTQPEFVEAYNKNKLATPLDTEFHFRETEKEELLEALESSGLVILSGKAGVGKTRLALECCREFKAKYTEYEVRCIFNRGPDLFEDLRVHFSQPGHFLILVDDANRVSRFEYMVQLLQDQRDDQHVKVIATVRDYAQETVLETARPFGTAKHVKLNPFDSKQLKEFVENEFGIKKHRYLDRIAEIAKGNPRLAVMAAGTAKRENTLQSISNVAQIYDEYFASIRKDIEQVGEGTTLKVAGIIVFFQYVDRTNQELMETIENIFDISVEDFWSAAHHLHDLEIVDMYENEVVRTADQVLATYLFYIVFFKQKLLEVSLLLHHFFPNFRERLMDSIHPVLNAFDTDAIIAELTPNIDRVWQTLVEEGKHDLLLHLIYSFWFLKKTDTLVYIDDRIQELESAEVDVDKLDFQPQSNTNIPRPSLLSIIESFAYSDVETCQNALELLFAYLQKQPTILPEVIQLLTTSFSFNHRSHLQGYRIQKAVIKSLWEHVDSGKNALFTKLFFVVVEKYLETHHHTTEAREENTLTLIDFDLLPGAEIFELRGTIWNGVFELSTDKRWHDSTVELVHKYSKLPYLCSSKEIVADDATYVLPFLTVQLDAENLKHCIVVHRYLNTLHFNDVPFDAGLRSQFTPPKYEIYSLLVSDGSERRFHKLTYEEYQAKKQQLITEYFSTFTYDGYIHFFEVCGEIQSGLDNHEVHNFLGGVNIVLLCLANSNPELFTEVLSTYLQTDGSPTIIPNPIVGKLIEILGHEKAHYLMVTSTHPAKRNWLFGFHVCLSEEDISQSYVEELYSLYRDAETHELPFHLDYLVKYNSFDPNVVPNMARIVLKKSQSNPDFLYKLEMLFNPHTELNKGIIRIFKDDLNLLKRVYLAMSGTTRHTDYDFHTLNQILDLDPEFMLEYIDWLYEETNTHKAGIDHHDCTKLWLRSDYSELMTQVAEHIYCHEQKKPVYWSSKLEDFFETRENKQPGEEIRERYNNVVTQLINTHYMDQDFIEFLFYIVAKFEADMRTALIKTWLEKNTSFEAFRRIPLEPNSWSWSGSRVPQLQQRIDFFDSLLPSLRGVKFLKHKQAVEQQIDLLRKQIEYEKKREFMRE